MSEKSRIVKTYHTRIITRCYLYVFAFLPFSGTPGELGRLPRRERETEPLRAWLPLGSSLLLSSLCLQDVGGQGGEASWCSNSVKGSSAMTAGGGELKNMVRKAWGQGAMVVLCEGFTGEGFSLSSLVAKQIYCKMWSWALVPGIFYFHSFPTFQWAGVHVFSGG